MLLSREFCYVWEGVGANMLLSLAANIADIFKIAVLVQLSILCEFAIWHLVKLYISANVMHFWCFNVTHFILLIYTIPYLLLNQYKSNSM